MNVEIPDNCECEGKDFVCNHCIWNTACSIEDLRESYERECALSFEDVLKRREGI